jgi:hypothetical protein
MLEPVRGDSNLVPASVVVHNAEHVGSPGMYRDIVSVAQRCLVHLARFGVDDVQRSMFDPAQA